MPRPARVTWTGVNVHAVCRACRSLLKHNAENPTSPALLFVGRPRGRPADNWLAIRSPEAARFTTVRPGDTIVRRPDGTYTVEAA